MRHSTFSAPAGLAARATAASIAVRSRPDGSVGSPPLLTGCVCGAAWRAVSRRSSTRYWPTAWSWQRCSSRG